MMIDWTTFQHEAPEIAGLAEKRLEATGLILLATIRRDGYPRISPVEPLLHEGKMRLGMMPRSTKALDLRRDPRCAVHTATVDKNVTDGDVKLWGRAVEVTDEDELDRYAAALEVAIGWRPEVGKFHLFDLDLRGASSLTSVDGAMHVTTWHPGRPVRLDVKQP